MIPARYRGRDVEVLSDVADGRRFCRLLDGVDRGSTGWLLVDELVLAQPEQVTCPHGDTRDGFTYHPGLGLWVHAAEDCRLPTPAHLRGVAAAEGVAW